MAEPPGQFEGLGRKKGRGLFRRESVHGLGPEDGAPRGVEGGVGVGDARPIFGRLEGSPECGGGAMPEAEKDYSLRIFTCYF